MSLFESASLVVTPNGTKASKLYAIKPTSGTGDLTVTRATTARRVNSAGLVETVANNVPRLDYLNSTCPSILVEPQRTNLNTYSEDFSNAIYIKVGASVSTNTTVAPDGTTTGDKLTEDTSNGIHTSALVASQATGGDYTFSVFVKADGRTKFQLAEAFSIGGNVNFDLTAVTATTTAPAKNGKIENYGNGWYRCSATWSFTGGATTVLYLNLLDNSGAASYTGNGTSGVILWGAQLEAGSYSTSYIPTTTASVTRNADVISKTSVSSLIGQTEGTIYFEYLNKNGLGTIPFRINGNDGKFIWIRGTGAMFFGNSSSLLFNNYSTPTANQLYKIAFVYGQNDFRLYVNGSLISSITTGTFTGTFDDVQIPALPNEDPFGQQVFIKSTALWKSKLTNVELAQLTTL